jgi:hypothetical protein
MTSGREPAGAWIAKFILPQHPATMLKDIHILLVDVVSLLTAITALIGAVIAFKSRKKAPPKERYASNRMPDNNEMPDDN